MSSVRDSSVKPAVGRLCVVGGLATDGPTRAVTFVGGRGTAKFFGYEFKIKRLKDAPLVGQFPLI
jgi:hypothetical protein